MVVYDVRLRDVTPSLQTKKFLCNEGESRENMVVYKIIRMSPKSKYKVERASWPKETDALSS